MLKSKRLLSITSKQPVTLKTTSSNFRMWSTTPTWPTSKDSKPTTPWWTASWSSKTVNLNTRKQLTRQITSYSNSEDRCFSIVEHAVTLKLKDAPAFIRPSTSSLYLRCQLRWTISMIRPILLNYSRNSALSKRWETSISTCMGWSRPNVMRKWTRLKAMVIDRLPDCQELSQKAADFLLKILSRMQPMT